MQIEQNKKEIEEEIRKLEEIEKKIMKNSKSAPKGHLRCKKRGKSFQYYVGESYLGKAQKSLIEEMANHEYHERLLPLVRDKISKLKHLKKVLDFDFRKPEKLYDTLHPARKCLVKPLLMSPEAFMEHWQAEPYEQWEITEDEVRGNYVTDKGERVRSKSEKIIADTLNRLGIPYKYEYPLRLTEGKKIVTKRPDFLVLSPVTLEEKIIEHLGMMDDEQYYLRNINKIELYEKNGYLIGKNLILLHETAKSPLDTAIMEQYLREFLL